MMEMQTSRRKVLVVDDDLRLRDLLKRFLGEQGFAVDTVPDAAAMDRQMARMRYDLLVLDLMLPGEDGLAACRRLRAAGDKVAILMLTAKGNDVDRIAGLDNGADDYLPKPFNPRELVARINSVLRRQEPPPMPGSPSAFRDRVGFGPFSLELSTRSLSRDGVPVPITTGEFSLLKVLAQYPRQPMSRDKLMELARGRTLDSSDRSIDVQVSRLRRLLGEDPHSPRFIQTVWGFGYVFVPDGASLK
jgi:two-component system, OmpR family, phosphate regulon response regulator OmpR